jgi:hypothetical protein
VAVERPRALAVVGPPEVDVGVLAAGEQQVAFAVEPGEREEAGA